ncbi:MBOAT family O-acyltransferase [uncultured Duncaniella sp.]|uniref:MBOAT family O-acyltransferase n=1 Tax=uncultured Duncaniella sp. TaxID=2768039 RepID=UPI0025FFD26A|nr:MBOAT family O-acyltransferase [uncultured Duncaniella sp.]
MEALAEFFFGLAAKATTMLEAVNIDIDRLVDVLRYDPHQPLMFNTGLFMLLFVAFMILFWIVKGVRVLKMALVILFSIYFYYKSSGICCLILLGVCVSDYVLGLLMEQADKRGFLSAKKLIVGVNVVVNVGMLAYFKYFHLILDTLSNFFTINGGFESLLLPAGISFFTFRSISYIVDLYRGQLSACHSLFDYVFFLTFFPPLLAGPVVRAKDFLPQIKGNPIVTRAMTSEGVYLIMTGLVKKVVIADFISGNFVDRVFDNPALYSGFENMMATLGFTVQLYCDFSGYSDMAIGIALLIGYRFLENFNAPFKAQNPTEFWHRWHISLSTWLRDYLYIPLGGNRCSRSRMYFNQFATMVIGGLWHGASWMYVIWGALHGGLLVIHKFLRRVFPLTVSRTVVTEAGEVVVVDSGLSSSPWIKGFNMILTFVIISVTFMFFRAPSLEDVGMMWHQILFDFHLSVAPQFVAGYLNIVLLIAGAYLIHITPSRLTNRPRVLFENAPVIVQAVILAIVILVVIQVRQSDIVPFIYLQY